MYHCGNVSKSFVYVREEEGGQGMEEYCFILYMCM